MPKKREPTGPYEVGYCRPPKRSQFKVGQSGNPRGGRTGAKGLKTLLREELSATVQITEGGKTRRVSKLSLIIKRLVEKGAKGNDRSIEKLLEYGAAIYGFDDPGENAVQLSEQEQAILDDLKARRSRIAEIAMNVREDRAEEGASDE